MHHDARTDDLFKPSLTRSDHGRPPYSSTATFLTSFFGGVAGAACISALNAWRLRRPSWEYALATGFLASGLYFTFWLGQAQALETLPSWLQQGGVARHLNKLAGVLVSGLFFLLHRRDRQALMMSAAEEPNSWPAALGILAFVWLLNLAVVYLGGRLV